MPPDILPLRAARRQARTLTALSLAMARTRVRPGGSLTRSRHSVYDGHREGRDPQDARSLPGLGRLADQLSIGGGSSASKRPSLLPRALSSCGGEACSSDTPRRTRRRRLMVPGAGEQRRDRLLPQSWRVDERRPSDSARPPDRLRSGTGSPAEAPFLPQRSVLAPAEAPGSGTCSRHSRRCAPRQRKWLQDSRRAGSSNAGGLSRDRAR